MLKYIHGSSDSTDVDVMYMFDEIPCKEDASRFCSDNTLENKNIAVVRDGVVVYCYKGTADEVNNSLYRTIPLHDNPPCIIDRMVARDVLAKIIRVMRGCISHCSRTKWRSSVKNALHSYSWHDRVELLGNIAYNEITDYGKQSIDDIYKFFSFQFGQIIGLLHGKELYTKNEIAEEFPQLRPYLYRQKQSFDVLDNFRLMFFEHCANLNVIEENNIVYFVDYEKKYDLRQEVVIF
jgi:hypothetical protein